MKSQDEAGPIVVKQPARNPSGSVDLDRNPPMPLIVEREFWSHWTRTVFRARDGNLSVPPAFRLVPRTGPRW